MLLNHKLVASRGTAKLAARPPFRIDGSGKAMRHGYPSKRIVHVVAMSGFSRVFFGMSVLLPLFIRNQDVAHSTKKVPRRDGSDEDALTMKRPRGVTSRSRGFTHRMERKGPRHRSDKPGRRAKAVPKQVTKGIKEGRTQLTQLRTSSLANNSAVHMFNEHGFIPSTVMETLKIGAKEFDGFMINFRARARAAEIRTYNQGPR